MTDAPTFLAELNRTDQIRADIFFKVAAADGKNQQASLPLIREPFSHSEKTVAQPSSFVRAVSSETLSVGA